LQPKIGAKPHQGFVRADKALSKQALKALFFARQNGPLARPEQGRKDLEVQLSFWRAIHYR
jgi:hypothetical protein